MKVRLALAVAVTALFAACTVTPNPVVPDASNITGPIGKANAVSGQVDLTQAMQVAQAWYAENGSFSGFNAAAAEAQEPSLTYNDSTTAATGQVSIRVVSPTAVVVATKDASGNVACMGYDGATGTSTSGATDAGTVEDCA